MAGVCTLHSLPTRLGSRHLQGASHSRPWRRSVCWPHWWRPERHWCKERRGKERRRGVINTHWGHWFPIVLWLCGYVVVISIHSK